MEELWRCSQCREDKPPMFFTKPPVCDVCRLGLIPKEVARREINHWKRSYQRLKRAVQDHTGIDVEALRGWDQIVTRSNKELEEAKKKADYWHQKALELQDELARHNATYF